MFCSTFIQESIYQISVSQKVYSRYYKKQFGRFFRKHCIFIYVFTGLSALSSTLPGAKTAQPISTKFGMYSRPKL